MHTRRVGAFVIGAWLIGTILVAFLSSQSLVNVDRFFANPPLQVAKELNDIGRESMRQILHFQAVQYSRHITETWEIIQLGLGAALLATSFLTSHRSKIVLICTGIMTIMVAIMYFYLTPVMNALGRSFDFMPVGAAVPERENFNYYFVWYRVLEILKSILGLTIAGRLLFDRYEWQDRLIPGAAVSGKGARRRRRSKLSRDPFPSTSRAADASAGEQPPLSSSDSASRET
jgi:hypothetical protein